MSNRKPTFFTSDWHVGHANSIKFDNRPFRDLEHMHKSLIKNYNAIVPEHGICYFLGDFGMMGSKEIKEFLAKLNGTKVLILGNHDKKTNSMYNSGFDVVLYEATLYIAGERVTMTHCPLRGLFREDISNMKGAAEGDLWHGESRQIQFSIDKHDGYHLSGHIHSPNRGRSKKIEGKQYDVGVVANSYRPVSLGQLESWINKHKMKEQK